jgi:hypothetical protein
MNKLKFWFYGSINGFVLRGKQIKPETEPEPEACFQSGPRFKIELEFRNVDFYEGRKTGEPGEKPSKQGRESTTIYIIFLKIEQKQINKLISYHRHMQEDGR